MNKKFFVTFFSIAATIILITSVYQGNYKFAVIALFFYSISGLEEYTNGSLSVRTTSLISLFILMITMLYFFFFYAVETLQNNNGIWSGYIYHTTKEDQFMRTNTYIGLKNCIEDTQSRMVGIEKWYNECVCVFDCGKPSCRIEYCNFCKSNPWACVKGKKH